MKSLKKHLKIFNIKVVILILLYCQLHNCQVCYRDGVETDENGSSCSDYKEKEVIISTKSGTVRGIRKDLLSKNVDVFLGIPYAKPPLGRLRFRKPEPVESWNQVLNANEKIGCIQPKSFNDLNGIKITEDCLHLNIWAPAKVDNDRLPVMFYIHGGSFFLGAGSLDEFDGIALASLGDVVIVTINYRLGYFGFFYNGDITGPGNMGLYDQALALTWVKDNIDRFGGDPEKITVFGESAGGISTSCLIVSPLTRGLFKRAIIQSGSAYSPIRPEHPNIALAKSLEFSRAMKCSGATDSLITEDALACLLKLKASDINSYSKGACMHSPKMPNPIFMDPFLPNNMFQEFRKNQFKSDVDVLIGITEDEGFLFVAEQLKYIFTPNSREVIDHKQGVKYIEELLKGRPFDPEYVANFYLNKSEDMDSEQIWESIIQMYGDLYVNCPVYFLAHGLSVKSVQNVHAYMVTSIISKTYTTLCQNWTKVCHADDIPLVFGLPLRYPDIYSVEDYNFSKKFMRIWTQFADKGTVPWAPFLESTGQYFELGKSEQRRISSSKFTNCDIIWRNLFDEKME